jgi:hypothetical protein
VKIGMLRTLRFTWGETSSTPTRFVSARAGDSKALLGSIPCEIVLAADLVAATRRIHEPTFTAVFTVLVTARRGSVASEEQKFAPQPRATSRPRHVPRGTMTLTRLIPTVRPDPLIVIQLVQTRDRKRMQLEDYP